MSNWFANARRRLKNTVGQSGLTWKNRIKLYNQQARGNADQVSLASSGSGETEADFTAEGGKYLKALDTLNIIISIKRYLVTSNGELLII